MKKVVTLGEVLMRINPMGAKKFFQSTLMEHSFGGTEVNVAISLSTFGTKTQLVSVVSDDFLGDAAIGYLRKHGVRTEEIKRSSHPLGLYFLERGSVYRSTNISYNRANSAFSKLEPQDFDWENILEDSDFFHWTGITPAASENTYNTLKKALEVAKKKGIKISADISFRKDQWNYDRDPLAALRTLVGLSSVFIGGIYEIDQMVGLNEVDPDDFMGKTQLLMERFPNLEVVFDKKRTSINASYHKISGRCSDGEHIYETPEYEITHIVDRIGTGDAFAAGMIYGLITKDDLSGILHFATAACALKHSVVGDANLVGVEEVRAVMNGKSGRINR